MFTSDIRRKQNFNVSGSKRFHNNINVVQNISNCKIRELNCNIDFYLTSSFIRL